MNVKCSQCGIAHNNNFCPNCGTLAAQGNAVKPIKKNMSAGMIVGLTFIGLLSFILIIGLIGSSISSNSPSSDNGDSPLKEAPIKQSKFQQATGTTVEQEENILKILKHCGIEIKSINHDEILDNTYSNGETGYRISTEDVNNVILYLKPDKTVNIVRYASNDMYADGVLLSTIDNYYISYSVKLDLKSSCEKTIKEILKSPSTAKFPGLSKWSMWKDEGVAYVQGYVDAQNSFGAMLRSDFQFIIDNRTVISLIFDGEEYISYSEQDGTMTYDPLDTVSYTAPSITPVPTPLPTATPTPKSTKVPTPTSEPDEDYSDWILFQTDMYYMVREGLLNGEVAYIEYEYYLVSPTYYDDVLEPYMDALLELQEEFAYTIPARENILDPDAEYEFIDDPRDNYDIEAVRDRINEMIESELAVLGDD